MDLYHLLKISIHMQPKLLKTRAKKSIEILFDSATKSGANAIKTASKRAIQKTAEATGDLIVSKIANKTTNRSKTSSPNDELIMKWKYQRKVYISRKKATNYWWIKISIA